MKNPIRLGYRKFDLTELINLVENIDISRDGNFVITKYFNRVIKITKVSDIYEVFDIKSFIKSKIHQILNSFNISYYKFSIKGGRQSLILLSDEVDINSVTYYKSFYILNSTDKSRKLNLNLGLYRTDNDSHIITGINNISLSKKHLRGVSQLTDEVSSNIDFETFDEQVKSIESLVGQRVLLSSVRDIIVDKDLKVNHSKFDAFKNKIHWSSTDRERSLTSEQINVLTTPSQNLVLNRQNDFSLNAYKVFHCYVQIFSREDCFIVKKETEKILKITQCFLRNERLEEILDSI